MLVELLDSREKRQLKMMECLYGGEWFILKDLSDRLAASERTLREDIKYLNEEIKPLQIETSKQNGVRLLSRRGYSLKYYYGIVLKKSLAFNILESLFLHKFNDIESLADRLYISVEQLRKKVRKINQVLGEFNFQVDLKKLAVNGDELTVVSFYRNYFLERYNNQLPFPSEIISGATEAVVALYATEKAKILPLNRNLLAFFTMIRIIRIQQDQSQAYHQRVPLETYTQGIVTFNQQINKLALTTVPYDFFQDIWRPQGTEFFCFKVTEFQALKNENQDLLRDYRNILALATEIESTLGMTFSDREWFIFNFYNISLQEKYFFPILQKKVPNLLANAKNIIPFVYNHLEKLAAKYAGQLFAADQGQMLYNIITAWDTIIEDGIELQPKLKVAMYSVYNSLTFHNNYYLLKHEFANLFDISMVTEDFNIAQKSLNQAFDLVITDQLELDVAVDTFCFPYDISLYELDTIKAYYHEVTHVT